MSAFDEFERHLLGPAREGSSRFAYLNSSARPEAMAVRAQIDQMLVRYPDQHRDALTARIRSVSDVHHGGAVFELALHEALLRSGCRILSVEPDLPDRARSPDFHAETPDGSAFYVEATQAIGETPADAGARTRLEDVLRALDELVSPDFFLDVSTDGRPSQPVRTRRLQERIVEWLAGLNHEKIKAAWDVNPAEMVALVIEEHGLTLTIKPIPRNDRGQQIGGAIGLQMMEPYVGRPSDGIREAVDGKARRYGDLRAPYIVAVNAMAEFQGEEDAIDALLGSPTLVIRRDADGGLTERWDRERNGVWVGERGPRNRGVSAVLSFDRLSARTLENRQGRLIRNPWARQALPNIPLGLTEFNPADGKLVRTEGSPLGHLLGLPNGWPG
jgi:hypothetical protein